MHLSHTVGNRTSQMKSSHTDVHQSERGPYLRRPRQVSDLPNPRRAASGRI
jgi:hypothetical protein